MTDIPLSSVRVRNYKAIRDSGKLHLGALTVLVGANGSGKSSLIEALETLCVLAVSGVDVAFGRVRGISHVHNKLGIRGDANPVTESGGAPGEELIRREEDAMHISFAIDGGTGKGERFLANSSVESDVHANRVRIGQEIVVIGERNISRNVLQERHRPSPDGEHPLLVSNDDARRYPAQVPAGESILGLPWLLRDELRSWQFLSMNPLVMGEPVPRSATGEPVRLRRDASNLADFLFDLYDGAPDAFQEVLQSMTAVLPYAADIVPVLTSELERAVYLRMTESSRDAGGKDRKFIVPGWLLSTGTVRAMALLALLHHPNPPRVLFIEELENGLDPRTIGLLVQEIRDAMSAGRTQIVLTTHSPYLLDLLPLDSIVLVDRGDDGAPVFWRPNDDEAIREWSKKFAPGRLYTTGALSRGGKT